MRHLDDLKISFIDACAVKILYILPKLYLTPIIRLEIVFHLIPSE